VRPLDDAPAAMLEQLGQAPDGTGDGQPVFNTDGQGGDNAPVSIGLSSAIQSGDSVFLKNMAGTTLYAEGTEATLPTGWTATDLHPNQVWTLVLKDGSGDILSGDEVYIKDKGGVTMYGGQAPQVSIPVGWGLDEGQVWTIEAKDPGAYTNAPEMSCKSGGSWTRPSGDVSNSEAGVAECAEKCADYKYFGLECPRSTVHCQCANTLSGSNSADIAECQSGHGHCTGPYLQGGFDMGGHGYGSVYLVTPPPAPIVSGTEVYIKNKDGVKLYGGEEPDVTLESNTDNTAGQVWTIEGKGAVQQAGGIHLIHVASNTKCAQGLGTMSTADTRNYGSGTVQRALENLAEPYSIQVSFTGTNDAHIFLSEGGQPTSSNGYEIVLGGWGNAKSVIRDGSQSTELTSTSGEMVGGGERTFTITKTLPDLAHETCHCVANVTRRALLTTVMGLCSPAEGDSACPEGQICECGGATLKVQDADGNLLLQTDAASKVTPELWLMTGWGSTGEWKYQLGGGVQKRIAKFTDESLVSCKNKCKEENECTHFSFGTSDAGNNAGDCMLCRVQPDEASDGFDAYAMQRLDAEYGPDGNPVHFSWFAGAWNPLGWADDDYGATGMSTGVVGTGVVGMVFDGCVEFGEESQALIVSASLTQLPTVPAGASETAIGTTCCKTSGSSVECQSKPNGTCLTSSSTYSVAEQACQGLGDGWDLCSKAELLAGTCCETGCYDDNYVWTRDVAGSLTGYTGPPVSPCSSQCNWKCYLNRYSDLTSSLGATNLDGAEAHYNSNGKAEGRDCTCSDTVPTHDSRGTQCTYLACKAGCGNAMGQFTCECTLSQSTGTACAWTDDIEHPNGGTCGDP